MKKWFIYMTAVVVLFGFSTVSFANKAPDARPKPVFEQSNKKESPRKYEKDKKKENKKIKDEKYKSKKEKQRLEKEHRERQRADAKKPVHPPPPPR